LRARIKELRDRDHEQPTARSARCQTGGLPAQVCLGRTTPRVLRTLRTTISPCLASAALHAVLLVALAVLTSSPSEHPRPLVVAVEHHAQPELAREFDHAMRIDSPKWDHEASWGHVAPSESAMAAPLTVALRAWDLSAEPAPGANLAQVFGGGPEAALSDHVGRAIHTRGAQFFGIQATGDRFVFIVDSSTSMTPRFDDAKRELESAVRRLKADQWFYVIFFDREMKPVRLGEWNSKRTRYLLNRRPEPDLVPATAQNVDGLVQWMNTIQLDSETNPYPAVVHALETLRPDAVFLLSDGEFRDNGATELFLLRNNLVVDPELGRDPKVVVHCVGFHSRLGEPTLQRIAAANGGTYRFVEPPPGLQPSLFPFSHWRGPRR
jgi:hypothetical protein